MGSVPPWRTVPGALINDAQAELDLSFDRSYLEVAATSPDARLVDADVGSLSSVGGE